MEGGVFSDSGLLTQKTLVMDRALAECHGFLVEGGQERRAGLTVCRGPELV